MSRYLVTFGLAATLLAGAAHVPPAARAADKKAEESPAVKPGPDSAATKGAEALAAAYTIARLGRETKSPEMLLAAARVIGTTGVDKFDAKAVQTGATAEEYDPAKEAADLIKEAKALAGARAAAVTTLAAALESDLLEARRGAAGGPKVWVGRVEARYNRFDYFDCVFRGNQPAVISVQNLSGQGDLDLVVRDLDGNIVASDRRPAGGARVTFFVPHQKMYRIAVKAYSDRGPVRYQLLTN